MKYFRKYFETPEINLYPIGDFHYGSRQCDVKFIRKTIEIIKNDPIGWWVGMGDLMENAIIGSKSDVYLQRVPPEEQIETLVELLEPIKDKALFLIAGNHEQRTMRVVGLIPEQVIASRLMIPYKGYSCYADLILNSKTPKGFKCYFHHNYGGGYTAGGKVNKANQLRKIVPTADAIFSGHFHITSRIPVQWFDTGKKGVIEHIGYDYITGSALQWHDSYAEEKAKPPAVNEFIMVNFKGSNTGRIDNREQNYHIIKP